MTLHKTADCKRVLVRSGMELAKPAPTPMVENIDDLLTRAASMRRVKSVTKGFCTEKLMGSLIHLSTHTRADITFAVNLLSRFMETPSRWIGLQQSTHCGTWWGPRGM